MLYTNMHTLHTLSLTGLRGSVGSGNRIQSCYRCMKVLDKAVSLKLSQVRIIISQLGLTPSVQPISYICYDWLCIYFWLISKDDHLCGVMNIQLFCRNY
jgi:hypothetical protein